MHKLSARLRSRDISPGIPLRLLITGPFILELILAMCAIGYLSFRNGQKAVSELAEQLHTEITNRVQQQLNHYLNDPHLINRINVSTVRLGSLDLQDIEGLERHFWQQTQLFPSTSYIYAGISDTLFVGAEQVPEGLPNVAYWTADNPQGLFETYSTNMDGSRSQLLSTVANYDLSQRPWYTNAQEAGGPVWGDIYVWAAPYPNIALPAVQPLYDSTGSLQAVFAVDLSLKTISDFLQTIEIGKTGEVFILEENGLLVSASSAEPILLYEESSLSRMDATQSSNTLIKGATEYLQEEFGAIERIVGTYHFDFQFKGEHHRAKITPYRDEWGLNWRIVVVVPESDFMASINANSRTTTQLSLMALAVALAIGIIIAHWVVQPIKQLSTASHDISKGDWNREVPRGNIHELRILSTSFNWMARQLIHDASYDSLTNLPNRSFFLKRLTEVLETMRGNISSNFAVLFLDFDRFKIINDSYGHMTGDFFLVKVSRLLQTLMPLKGTLARLGGDEFAILLENIQSEQDAIVLSERIQQILRQPLKIDNRTFFATASIGIVLGGEGHRDALDVLRDADLAMYAAKAAGKDRFEIFDASMHDKALSTLSLENDLRRALDNQEFELYYQPIVSLRTGQLSGFEALIRWNHPEKGLITPGHFIKVAEDSQLIQPIGEWVLNEVCRTLQYWQSCYSHSDRLTVNVNLSGKQLFDPYFLTKLDSVLDRHKLAGNRLHLEITESTLMERSLETMRTVMAIRRKGIRLSIDDFGTGYSSLAYLQQLPVDIVKVPRCFVSQIDSTSARYEITRAITTLAHTLKLKVIAEGIEEHGELDQIVALGCEFGQGYLFDRPMNAAMAEEWLASKSAVQTMQKYLKI